MKMNDQEYREILSMYLPYGVDTIYDYDFVSPRIRKLVYKDFIFLAVYAKPILRPLSDFSDINSPAMKELERDGLIKSAIYHLANGYIKLGNVPYEAIKAMAAAHIDYADLIEKGMAINLNELTNK